MTIPTKMTDLLQHSCDHLTATVLPAASQMYNKGRLGASLRALSTWPSPINVRFLRDALDMLLTLIKDLMWNSRASWYQITAHLSALSAHKTEVRYLPTDRPCFRRDATVLLQSLVHVSRLLLIHL